MSRARLLFGISVFWLPLSMLSDGITALVLPTQLLPLLDQSGQATTLGLVTFGGLLLGMLVQPLAGMLSDRMRSSGGRRRLLSIGALGILLALVLFGQSSDLAPMVAAYLAIQLALSVAQAAQQGFVPDLV